jgi:SSS family solute:Na+ symporter
LLVAACYWKRANSWGAAGSIIVSALIPLGFLILEKTNGDLAKQIGPYYSGIAAYACSALAMIVGSLLKPQKNFGGEI